MWLCRHPEGDCDCDGNVVDECGVCDCPGIPEGACDCAGTLPVVTIGTASASSTKTTMAFLLRGRVCSAEVAEDNFDYKLIVEEYHVGAQGTTYRFYINVMDPTDKISAVFGNENALIIIPLGIYNDPLNSTECLASTLLFSRSSQIWLTTASQQSDLMDLRLVWNCRCGRSVSGSSIQLNPSSTGYFQSGGTELNVNTLTGALVCARSVQRPSHRRTMDDCTNHHYRIHLEG